MIKRIVFAMALIVMGYGVKAEGFAVNLQGNKQVGMGHVGTALSWDASCMQFNPGALAMLKNKISFSAGGSLTFTTTKFDSNNLENIEKSDNPVGTPFYFYGSYKVCNDLAVGVGVYTPFGNSVEWGKDWSGKYLMQDITLQSFYIQPTISYRLADWVSVGAGLNVVYGSYDLNKAVLLTPLPDGAVNLKGSAVKFGYNVGVYLQPTDQLSFGISYRSKVDMTVDDGDAEFSNIPESLPPALAAFFSSKKANGALPLPASLNVGVAYQINEKLLVSADVNAVFWDAYEELSFTFEPIGVTQASKRDWKNTLIYRLGAQYAACEKLDLRAGIYYDQTPTNDQYYSPETPGANKVGVSAGFSYKVGEHLSVDASLLYLKGDTQNTIDKNSPIGADAKGNVTYFGGEYKSHGWIPGIGITYNL